MKKSGKMNTKESACECCCHSSVGAWGGHSHALLRIILALVLLSFVFTIGMKFGEFKSFFSDERHSRHFKYLIQDQFSPPYTTPLPALRLSSPSATPAGSP